MKTKKKAQESELPSKETQKVTVEKVLKRNRFQYFLQLQLQYFFLQFYKLPRNIKYQGLHQKRILFQSNEQTFHLSH